MTTKRTKPRLRMARAVTLALLLVLLATVTALAHPLGNFTVNRYSKVTVGQDTVRLLYILDMAEIPTYQEMAAIDRNGDGEADEAEQADYLAAMAERLAGNLALTLNGETAAWRVSDSIFAFAPGQGGLNTLRLEFRFVALLPAGTLWDGTLQDGNFPDKLGWQEIVVVAKEGKNLLSSTVASQDISQELRVYPQDLLQSPPRVNSAAFQHSLALEADELNALVGMGMLALSRHDFAAAIPWAERALAVAPHKAEAVGLLVDATVELGRYDEALAEGQAMVNLRPGIASYSRASYLRELHGDTDGAIEAMGLALEVAVPGTESWRWTAVQLGQLHFNRGEWAEADVYYQAALKSNAAYPFALAGRGRVVAAQGNFENAIGFYAQAVDRLPLPEFVIPLGDLYSLTGQKEKAVEQYGLVRVIQQLNQAAGMAVDMELALFEADYGDSQTALQLARQAYAARPNIHAADVLAWALHRNGQDAEAQPYSAESLRLGTQDALLYYHAGVIAQALGQTDAARQHLQSALEINPAFSILYADDARQRLDTLH